MPKHGYAFEPFVVEGLPRKPSLALARAIAVDAAAPLRAPASCGAARPMRCSAAAASSPAPCWRGEEPADPSVLTEADRTSGSRTGWPRRWHAGCSWPTRSRAAMATATGSSDGRSTRRFFATPGRGAPRSSLPHDAFVLAASALAGALRVNLAVAARSATDPSTAIVLHRAGERDLETVRGAGQAPPRIATGCRDDRPLRARAGRCRPVHRPRGGSVFELAACGAPAILVPYPYATADHQAPNAEHYAAGGRRGAGRETRCRPCSCARSTGCGAEPGGSRHVALACTARPGRTCPADRRRAPAPWRTRGRGDAPPPPARDRRHAA